MKRIILSVLSLGLLSSVALAADMPTKTPAQQPVTVYDTFTWTGPFVGFSIGYLSKDESSGFVGNNSLSSSLISHSTVPSSVNVRPNGMLIGGQLGYDYQFGRGVIGIVGDWSYADAYGTGTALGNLVNRSVDEKIDQFGTIRAKLGYLVDQRTLLYGTVGGAWAHIRTTVTSSGSVCSSTFINCASGSSSDTRWGWAFGGGIEHRMSRNWSLSLEAIYAPMRTQQTVLTGNVYKSPLSYTMSQDVNVGIVRTGLSYRF